jgi:hypothetical protein
MRIPIAPGTPSGALPAATAARSLAHKESTRRSAGEPNDGATATGPMEHSVSTASPDPDATEIGSVSGFRSRREPVLPLRFAPASGHLSAGWRPNGGRRTVVQRSRAENRP